jgi:hypothetical protein
MLATCREAELVTEVKRVGGGERFLEGCAKAGSVRLRRTGTPHPRFRERMVRRRPLCGLGPTYGLIAATRRVAAQGPAPYQKR